MAPLYVFLSKPRIWNVVQLSSAVVGLAAKAIMLTLAG